MQTIEFVDLPKIKTRTTGGDDHRISRKRFQFERLQIHRDQSATNLVVVEHERQHFPVLKLSDFAADFVAPYLFVECVKKLLAGRSAGKRSAVMFRAAEATKIEQAFLRAREGNTHAIEQVNDRGRHLAHGFRRWLIGEKVAAVNSVVEMFPGRIAFAFGVDRAVDAALRANRMRTLHRND